MKRSYFYIVLGSIMILSYFGILTYNGIKDIGAWEMFKIIGGISGVILWMITAVFLVNKGISLRNLFKKGK